MRRVAGGRTLRRAVLVGSVTFGVAATLAILALVLASVNIRKALDRSDEQLKVEQRIADHIVDAAYGQQLAAFRFLHQPGPAILRQFRESGLLAYGEIQKYLFRDMPLGSRMKVELIKEAHEDFEVAAHLAFDRAASGESLRVEESVNALSHQGSILQETVRRFIRDRELQREVLRARLETRLLRLETALMAAALVLALSVILMAELLRRRVMLPLNDLSLAVRELGDGVRTVYMPPQRYQEFQLLANSFDRMASRIHDSRREIEDRNAELTQTLNDLRRAQQELVQHEKLSAMGEMLAGLAHELNNPLAGVLGIAEILQSDTAASADPEVRRMGATLVEPLVAESIRARNIVRNLLNFARASEPHLERVRLAEPVAVAVGLCRHRFAQHQYAIEIEVADDLYVVAQTQKLEHVIINVVNNALDALKDGGGSRLRISAATEAGVVVVRFDDDGAGFQQLERAFDPFYTTKEVGEGTGLGLALVHRFVGEFGGAVTAENLEGTGARVTLRLAAFRDDAGATNGDVTKTPAVPEGDTVPTPTATRVLVVEDEPAIREVQRRLLSRLGCEVTTAANAADACTAILAGEFDLVITDLRMPGAMSGHDLLQWLSRKRPALARTALVVTGDIEADAADGSTLAPDRVLTKPFDRGEYELRVKRALVEARLHAATI